MNVKKGIRYSLFLILFTIIAVEVLLRIYNPFSTSVTGTDITLHTNTEMIVKNANYDGLDERIVVKRNSLGFRGPEPPAAFEDHLTILTIGGSTTECMFIREGNTWTDHLSNELNMSFKNTWINNAGFNGHSTYGHLKLLKQYVTALRPDCCIFLVGCNDVDRADLSSSDSTIGNEFQKPVFKIARYSRLVNIGLNFYRHSLAGKRQLTNTKRFSLAGKEERIISDSVIQARVSKQNSLAKRFRLRLLQIIQTCRKAGIEPVFITQPALLGNAVDDVTGIDLGKYPFNEGNGRLTWTILELYNDETRKVCRETNTFMIDAAAQLPKSSRYFYDEYHFNKQGCAKMSSIISGPLAAFLAAKFPEHYRN